MIKNVVFDLGNVLLNFKPIEYIRKVVQDEKLVEELNRGIFCGQEWIKLDEGTMMDEEAAAVFCQRNPQNKEVITKIMAEWYTLLTPIEGTVKILEALKEKGYKVYALSNYHIKAFEDGYKKHSFFKLFDGMIISSKVKCLKPGCEIYKRLIEEYNLDPKETAFIDDISANVNTAVKMGITGIQFKSPEKLEEDLKSLHIL